MTKVLIVGDTHGDAQFVSSIHKAAKAAEVEVIVQLGDFGYNFDPNLLASIRAWLDADEQRKWYWLDGNHDQHDYIEQTIIGDKRWDAPIAHFHDRMFYCPRGSVTQIGSKTCLFLGGAYSIDKHYRTEGVSWWPQELIRTTDSQRAIVNGKAHKATVMFCHDAPPSTWLEDELRANNYKVGSESLYNRRNLGSVVSAVMPKRLYHGHYHWRYTAPYICLDGWLVKVEGIGANVAVQHGHQYLDSTARLDHNYIIEDF